MILSKLKSISLELPTCTVSPFFSSVKSMLLRSNSSLGIKLRLITAEPSKPLAFSQGKPWL